jgi:pimeloyl-ACP methyl ester carboxylesterase
VLNYRVEGEGPAIVFLHGFLESISMWDFLPLKQFQARKIFIDLPGHGKSELHTDFNAPSLQFFTDKVVDVLNFLGVNDFSVVGHSMGGYVALMLKQQLSTCKKVVLLNSNFWADTEQKKKDRVRIADIAFRSKRILINESIPNLFGNPTEYGEAINKLKSEAMEMSSEAIAYTSLAMRERIDFSVEFNSTPGEYFIIHGENDRLVQTKEIESKIKDHSKLYIIPDAGHMAHIEASEELLSIFKLLFLYEFNVS